mmetsp:Transcript_61288/g.109080  ORF Transcript_61288/g.109080 Transcript_61288/m.109080 type:complete len:204 (-) Transcript_61288:19-630(-)
MASSRSWELPSSAIVLWTSSRKSLADLSSSAGAWHEEPNADAGRSPSAARSVREIFSCRAVGVRAFNSPPEMVLSGLSSGAVSLLLHSTSFLSFVNLGFLSRSRARNELPSRAGPADCVACCTDAPPLLPLVGVGGWYFPVLIMPLRVLPTVAHSSSMVSGADFCRLKASPSPPREPPDALSPPAWSLAHCAFTCDIFMGPSG